MPESKLDLKKRRIRAFFLTLEKKHKKHEETEELEEKISKEGMVYLQMRLPVEKITEEFENSLKEKIEHNIIKANIREATESDLENLMNLYNRAWLTTNTPFRPINVESLKLIFDDPLTVILIAKVYGQDSGFVILDFEGKHQEIGVIAGLGVIPRFQRRGLGTILGMSAWNYFKEKGVKELRCEVYKDNEISKSFIKWIGFDEIGEKRYKKDDFLLSERNS